MTDTTFQAGIESHRKLFKKLQKAGVINQGYHFWRFALVTLSKKTFDAAADTDLLGS